MIRHVYTWCEYDIHMIEIYKETLKCTDTFGYGSPVVVLKAGRSLCPTSSAFSSSWSVYQDS